MDKDTTSPAYKHFLDFFNLTQRERLDGLDVSYFSDMTIEEKKRAFEHLKNGFEFSVERIKGLYLCDSEKAISLFKETLKKQPITTSSVWEEEAFLMGKITMSGYVCNFEPTKVNIDYLASFDVLSMSKDLRSALYTLLPSNPTTKKAVELLEQAVLFEANGNEHAAGAADLFLSVHGIKFSMRDENYKRLGRGLLSDDLDVRKSMIEEIKSSRSPVYVG